MAELNPDIKRRLRKSGKALTAIGLIGSYWAGMGLISLFAHSAHGLPSVETFWETSRPPSVQIIDRHGKHVVVKGAIDAAPVKLSELPDGT